MQRRKTSISHNVLNTLPHNLDLATPRRDAMENTGDLEKMMETSIFTFFHSVLYSAKERINILAMCNLSSADGFNFVPSKIFLCGKELNVTSRQNSSHSKLEASSDKGLKVSEMMKFVSYRNCGKRRKNLLAAFSAFPTMFSKGLFKGMFVKE